MTLIDSVKTCFVEKPFSFKGRASRSEFWWTALAFYLGAGLIAGLMSMFDGVNHNTLFFKIGVVAFVVIAFYLVLVYFSATVRRLHDSSHSGWNILLRFIPYIGSFIVLYMLCIKSDEGENEYGPNPLGKGNKVPNNAQIQKNLIPNINEFSNN